tara:strand:- start:425 stop:760 length:336 start_codon:yes stop_codon:yes gene_type:complete
MENEMMYMPLVVTLIIGTAILTAVITTAMPYMPIIWQSFKTRIKHIFMRKRSTHDNDIFDVIQIQELNVKIDDLNEQVKNIAETQTMQRRNRKYNLRRDVREYLMELQEKK